MKSLYINNKRVIIDDMYFPFTYKISDLEEVNIIGVPQSKTVKIKRLPENDEIFGYIGEIHRSTFNFTEDNLIGCSFNQTKKAYYELFQDSELVSSGQVQVVGIDDISYDIVLYDAIVDLLEQFEGDSDTDKGYLSSMDIIKYDNTVFSANTNAYTVKTLTNDSVDVVPVFNIKAYDTTSTTIRCIDTTGIVIDAELPGEFTPIQARTLKNYEVEYAVPINTVIRSINKYQNDESSTTGVEYIKVEEDLNTLFDEVHLNCGSPSKPEIPTTEEFVVDEMDGYNFNYLTQSNYESSHTLNNNTVNYIKKNGTYYMQLPIRIKFDANDVNTSKILSRYNGVTYSLAAGTNLQVPKYGDKIGEVFVNASISGWNSTTKRYETIPIMNQLDLLFGKNITYALNGGGTKLEWIELNTEMILSYDIYPALNDLTGITTKFTLDYSEMFATTRLFSDSLNIFQNIQVKVFEGFGTYNTIELRTNDYYDGKMILPKVSIKDFVINLCKFYNLDIVNDNNSLLIRRKKYRRTDEILRIANINSVDVNLFNFNKLVLTTDVSSNELIDTYNKTTKQVYGQKSINTGYAIKPNRKEVNIPIGVPSLIKDTNKLAYDRFGSYFNRGRSIGRYGVTEGFEDRLVFGYINEITKDPIYITNDTYFEGGMWSNSEPTNDPEGISFKMNNEWLIYNDTNGGFTFKQDITPDTAQTIRLDKFSTISPYKFDINDYIIESLEMSKPKYNYAGITDVQYSETVTLYDRHHKKMLEDRYNVDTNIIDVDVYMDSMPDVYSVYNIKGSNYIISELTEYDPSTSGEIFQGVKLLKVNDVYSYGVSDYYNVELTQKLTFDGNIQVNNDRLLGFTYNTYGSSEDITDDFKLLTNNYSSNSIVSRTYDNDLDTTTVSQVNKSLFEVTPSYINKIKTNNVVFNYIADSVIKDYELITDEEVSIQGVSGSGTFNQQTLNQPLYLQSGAKRITEAGIYNPIKVDLECAESDGLFYWLIRGECTLKLNEATTSLTSASQFKFDDIAIQAKEQIGDSYTTFTWGHSDLLDVNYTYYPDGSLKFSFRAMLFQGSSYSGTLASNIGTMTAIAYPSSGYTAKISLDGTYTDYIDSEDTGNIVFNDSSCILDTFTGNNEILTTITAINYEVAYSYNK